MVCSDLCWFCSAAVDSRVYLSCSALCPGKPDHGVFEQVHLLILYLLLYILALGDYLLESVSLCKD